MWDVRIVPATVWGAVFLFLGEDLMRVALAAPPIYATTEDPDVIAMIVKQKQKPKLMYKNNLVLSILRPYVKLVPMVPRKYSTGRINPFIETIGVVVERVERNISVVFKRAAGFVPEKFNRPTSAVYWRDICEYYEREAIRIWAEHFFAKNGIVWSKDELDMDTLLNSVFRRDSYLYIRSVFRRHMSIENARACGEEFQRVGERLFRAIE